MARHLAVALSPLAQIDQVRAAECCERASLKPRSDAVTVRGPRSGFAGA